MRFAAHYHGPLFHALMCDPPYHLTSITQRFGKPNSAPARGDVYARAARGFMGQRWDGGDIAFRAETWAAFSELLYAGAFVMAFASARGWHRQAVAMEDAGLIIHPMMAWVFGSGFPKATQVKDARFDGHRYGLQALKPAMEPIIIAQKPYAGKPRESITETGAGALWIDGARIGSEAIPSNQWMDNAHPFGGGAGNDYQTVVHQGRWPANFVLQHSPECQVPVTCVPECAVRRMGEQSGERGGAGRASGPTVRKMGTRGIFNAAKGDGKESPYYGDEGTAARFFYNADWVAEKIELADPFLYAAKAGRKERDEGLVEGRNPHPTVKPISLTHHLGTLLLPPAEYAPRRLLVPFLGSGSEMIGGLLAGWDEIVGVEGEAEYVEIANRRLAFWESKKQAQMSLLASVL